MPKPILYIFNISHYCEKARWALEYFGIDYQLTPVMVGRHRLLAKRLGAARGSVPFLQVGSQVVSGSAAIVDWCLAHAGQAHHSFAGTDPARARAIEKRLDDVAGVHVRRFFYSDALLHAPASVRPLFVEHLPLWQRAVVTLAWPSIVQRMVKGLDLGLAQGLQSRAVVDAELAWLDGLLQDGRPYLGGDAWSRADLAAASLLAPLAAPAQHPMYHAVQFPEEVVAAMRAWADRPSMQLVRRAYAQHRVRRT